MVARPSLLASAVAFAVSCGTAAHRPSEPALPPVADADVGRLAPEQMGQIQSARADLAAAQDALARARLRLQDSRHEEQYAAADRTQAQADRQRGDADMRAAAEAGDERLRSRAAEELEQATLRAQAADARLDFARRLVAARDVDVQAAAARVRRGEWEVERAKLAALREAGIPAASKYDQVPYEKRVAEAAQSEQSLRTRARDLDQAAATAHARWRSLVDRYEARARDGAAGGG